MTTKEIRQANKGKYKKRVIFLWVLWLVGVLSVFFLFFFLSMSKDLPSVEDLQNPKDLLATEIVANDGSILGRFYIKNRVKVRYDELPENLVNSLISTEDKRFYDHAAVDLEALARVVKGIVTGTTSQGGGSTITQQLAKMQYSNRNIKGGKIARAYKLFTTKLKEWITAVQLERQYTKEEILMMYLNEFDFLNGAIGIKSASETYFAKQPKELDNQEAAVLVGMLKNPSMFNVKRFPQRAWDRHLTVLRLTRDAGHLPDEEFQKYMDTPDDEQFVPLTFSRKSHSEGIAPYFREELRYEVKKILAKIKKEKGREYDVHRDGLRVYTTLNPRMQIHAEASVRKNMSAKQKKFFKEWKGKDPWTHGAASKKEKEMRQKSFLRVLRESERFKAHREQFLDETLDVIAKSHDLRLKDYDIQRMVSEEEEGGVLTSLKNQGLLTKKKASKYRKIMKDDAWATLKEKWAALQDHVDKDFQVKRKMRVFAYNDKMEKDTVMSPWDSIRYNRMHLQTGVIAIDPRSGAVRAWVGGINHKYFKFDHVNERVERQVGSTMKPFIYATAISQRGFSPCYKVPDIPYTIHKGEGDFGLLKSWTPKNFGEYSGDEISLYTALSKSKNTVSAYLMKEIGSATPFRNLMRDMGIDVDKKNVYGEPRVPNQPSICLGATDLSVFEMTGAFSTFANNGFYQAPYFIERITDKNGNVIYAYTDDEDFSKRKQAMNPDPNFVMVEMLKKVANPIQGKLKTQVGGKTGTTNKASDTWFMGIAPEICMGVWVGGDDRWIRFSSTYFGQGGILARPIYLDFMKAVETDTLIDYDPSTRFKKPPGELSITIDCQGVYAPDGSYDPTGSAGADDDFGDAQTDDNDDGTGFDDFDDEGGFEGDMEFDEPDDMEFDEPEVDDTASDEPESDIPPARPTRPARPGGGGN